MKGFPGSKGALFPRQITSFGLKELKGGKLPTCETGAIFLSCLTVSNVNVCLLKTRVREIHCHLEKKDNFNAYPLQMHFFLVTPLLTHGCLKPCYKSSHRLFLYSE